MESIKQKFAKLNLFGKEWDVVFTVNVIDEIQDHFDININKIFSKLETTDREFYKNVAYVTMILINEQIRINNSKIKKENIELEICEALERIDSKIKEPVQQKKRKFFQERFQKHNLPKGVQRKEICDPLELEEVRQEISNVNVFFCLNSILEAYTLSFMKSKEKGSKIPNV